MKFKGKLGNFFFDDFFGNIFFLNSGKRKGENASVKMDAMQFVPSIIYRSLDTNEKKKMYNCLFFLDE